MGLKAKEDHATRSICGRWDSMRSAQRQASGRKSKALVRHWWHVASVCVWSLNLTFPQATAQFVNPRFGTVPSEFEKHNQAGIEAFRRGENEEAERFFLSAWQVAEGFAPDDPRRATTLNNLGQIYHALGKYSEAEPVYRQAMALCERIGAPD